MPKTRKKSEDGLQEHLRERKDIWNHACSAFIARINALKPHLISFKRGLNGRGDPHAGIPVTDIKNPLPGEISSNLHGVHSEFRELASIFDKLVSDADSIIQEQAQYAMKRRKSQPRQPRMHRHNPLAANLDINDVLVVEGSNSLTRMWARLSAWFSSDENKHKRLAMLEMSRLLFKDLIELEDEVLTSGVKNLKQLISNYLLVRNDFAALKNEVIAFLPPPPNKNNKQPDKPDLTAKPPPLKEQEESESIDSDAPQVDISNIITPFSPGMSIEELKANVLKMSNFGLSDQGRSHFLDVFHKERRETNENKKDLLKDRMQHIYQELFDEISAINKKSEVLDTGIVKSALLPNFVKEWTMTSKDPSFSNRKEIYAIIRKIKKDVNSVMDLLENKNADFKEITKKILNIETEFGKMSKKVEAIKILFEGTYLSSNDKIPYKNPNFNPINHYFTRRVRRNIDKPGW